MNQVQNMPVMITLHDRFYTESWEGKKIFEQGKNVYVNISAITSIKECEGHGTLVTLGCDVFCAFETPEEVMYIIKEAVRAEIPSVSFCTDVGMVSVEIGSCKDCMHYDGSHEVCLKLGGHRSSENVGCLSFERVPKLQEPGRRSRMTNQEAIKSFEKSNEQAKARLKVEKMRMDMNEVKELEFYIERDEMAIKALEQQDRIIQIIDDYDLEAWEILEKIKKVVKE